ncbi:MAG: tetratricopeptide repeat protein [Anaerolineae bacterium]
MKTVFISSTSKDLEEYRKAAVEVCVRLGFFPIAMEYFSAMPHGATEGSKSKVDKSDLYVGIFAHRYGYIEKGNRGKSVTEVEFDHAGKRGLDRLCFVVDSKHPWPPEYTDHKNYDKLNAFKKKIDKLIRASFTDVNDFRTKLMQALSEIPNTDDNISSSIAHPQKSTHTNISKSKSTVVRLDFELSELEDEKLLRFVARLVDIGIQEIQIVGKRTGSTILNLELPEDAANRLMEKLRNDPELLSQFQFKSISISAVLIRQSSEVIEKPLRLFGRDDLMREIMTLLDQNDRVLLQGLGGMGKTALAASVVSDWVKAKKGEVLWMRAGGAEADALFEALVRPFNASLIVAAESGDEKIRVVRNIIRQSKIRLIVLDDCWNDTALSIMLRALPSDLPILLTARQRFRVSSIFEVGELSPIDAVALFAFHSTLEESTEGIDSLCKVLGHHAFAIEIAAKYLRANRLSIIELLEQIKDAPEQLSLPSDFPNDGRENVAWLFESSLKILDDEVRSVFLSFGAFFAPSVTEELISLYLALKNGDSKINVSNCLEVLYQHGLVERISATDDAVTNYRIHELAYNYTQIRTSDTDRQYGLEACLEYASRHSQPSLANFAALRPVLESLLNAAEWAIEKERYLAVEQLTFNLYFGKNGGLLYFSGYFAEGSKLLERAIVAANNTGNKQNQIIYLLQLGHAHRTLGRVEQAISNFQQALAISREIGDRRGEGAHLGNLGLTYGALGQVEKAIDYHEQALAISREIGDKRGEGADLGNLGIAYSDLGQVARAINYYEQALTISREVGDRRTEGNHLGNLGTAYNDLGQVEQAIAYYEQALAIAREIGDRRNEGNHLGNLGTAYSDLGQVEKAIAYYEQALAISREIGDKRGEGNRLGNLGIAYSALGQVEQAIAYYEQALTIAREIGDKHGEGNWLGNLGIAYSALGQVEKAIGYTEQALAIAREIGDKRGEGNRLGNLGNAYRNLGQYDRAADYYQQSIQIKREIGDRMGEANYLGNIGNLRFDQGDHAAALDYYDQARAIYAEIGAQHLVKTVDANIAIVRGKLG